MRGHPRRDRPAAEPGERSPDARSPRHRPAASNRSRHRGTGAALIRGNRSKAKKSLNRGLSSALLVDVAQDPAALRDGLDELRAAAGIAQLLAQLGDEHVDDLGLRLIVAAAIEMFQ